MKEKINQIAKGNFEYEMPQLLLSVEKIEFVVEQGKRYRGSIAITNSERRVMKGVLYSTDANLILPKNTFVGEKVVVEYEYKATMDTEIGVKKSGYITLVTSFGEQMIPFQAKIIRPYFESQIGKVQRIDQLVELAKEDMMQAVHIFKSPEFKQTMLMEEKEKQWCYDSFAKSPSAIQALEEFFVMTKKKKPMELTVETSPACYKDVTTNFQDSFVVSKQEWGYVEAKLRSDVEFLVLERSVLIAEDFVMDECQVKYQVNVNRLKHGKNVGHIVITTPRQTLTYTVECERNIEHKKREKSERRSRHYESELMRRYLDFRLNRISKEEYIEGVKMILRNLVAIEPKTEYRLWLVHLDLIARKEEELHRIMNTLMGQEEALLEESLPNYLAYLYLKAMYTRKEADVNMAFTTIREYLDGEMKDWKLLWYLLYLDPQFEQDSMGKLRELFGEFEQGVTTPVLYFEACLIYCKEPQLLKDLDTIELRILHWGIREQFVSKELAQQYIFLAGRMKYYSQKVFGDLCRLYEVEASKDCLQAILRMLIIGRKTESRYFKWYELGIKQQIKVTELYEYYMYALEEEKIEEIDHSVLLYFIYNNHLSEQKKTLLYSYLIKQKEVVGSLYQTYSPQILNFAKRLLEREVIQPSLVPLYRELLAVEIEDSELNERIAKVLFRKVVRCNNPKMVGVVVVHEELKEEEVASFIKGQAIVTVLNEHAKLYLLDEMGNRYAGEEGYTISPMLEPQEWFERCFATNKENLYLLLYWIQKKAELSSLTEVEDRRMIGRVLEDSRVSEPYKGMLYSAMVTNTTSLDEYTYEVQLEYVNPLLHRQVMEYYIKRDMFEKAYAAVCRYGYEKLSVVSLEKLVLDMFTMQVENEYLQQRICYYLFKHGTNNERIIKYLCDTYIASTSVLYEIWKVAKKQQIPTQGLEERLLGQMIFSDTGMEYSYDVFISYYRHVQNKSLIKSYLNAIAYRYLIKRKELSDKILEYLKRESFYHESKVCMLAILKYYSKVAANGSLAECVEEETMKLLDYNLHKYITEGMILPCFKAYRTCIALPEVLYDRQFVEYIANPKNTVWIHYRILQQGEEKEFVSERMSNVYEGIHSKAFLLFYDETLEYYITEETKQGERCTERISYTQAELPINPTNRYGKLNLMYAAKHKKEKEELEALMKQYIIEEHVTTTLFTPL